MNNLRFAIRSLSKKRQYNLIKVLSLGCGLAVGLILLAKVSFEQTYNNYFPDKERIYQIMEKHPRKDGSEYNMERIPGGFVYYLGKDLPQVEIATRYRYLNKEPLLFKDSEKNQAQGLTIFADSCLFAILPHKLLAGNPQKILSSPMQALVSRSFAEEFGTNIFGTSIELDQYPGKTITIGGIFEDIPENTSFRYDVVISLSSLSKFDSYDGSFKPDDHNQFIGLIKLLPGVKPEELAASIKAIQKKYQEEFYHNLTYYLLPLGEVHANTPGQKQKTQVLGILAVSLLFVTVINYILLVISTVVGRYKEIAVYKCYGAQRENIVKMILSETTIHLVLALITATILIMLFRNTIVELLGTSLTALFFPLNILFLILVCLLILFLTSYIPAFVLTNTPVAFAMQNYKHSGKRRKLILLFVQFVVATAFFTLLVVIWSQYNLFINTNPGYKYDRLVYVDVSGVPQDRKQLAIQELSGEPIVQSVSATAWLPISVRSGGWIVPQDDSFEMRLYDMGRAYNNYFSTMHIPLIEGKDTGDDSMKGDLYVSRSFAEQFSELSGWQDIIGRHLDSGAYGKGLTIRGIFENVQASSFKEANPWPATIVYSEDIPDILLVELSRLTGENIMKTDSLLTSLIPDKIIRIIPYETSVQALYNKERLDRDSILICCLVTLIIVLMGLAAYVNSEVNRRTAEIAIRKINGARIREILNLFIRDILLIAFPALIIGSVIAYRAGTSWLENFYLKIPFHAGWLIVCSLILLAMILFIIVMNSLYVSMQNPVKALKVEN